MADTARAADKSEFCIDVQEVRLGEERSTTQKLIIPLCHNIPQSRQRLFVLGN